MDLIPGLLAKECRHVITTVLSDPSTYICMCYDCMSQTCGLVGYESHLTGVICVQTRFSKLINVTVPGKRSQVAHFSQNLVIATVAKSRL